MRGRQDLILDHHRQHMDTAGRRGNTHRAAQLLQEDIQLHLQGKETHVWSYTAAKANNDSICTGDVTCSRRHQRRRHR